VFSKKQMANKALLGANTGALRFSPERPGDSYTIPRDVEHSLKVIEPGEVLDFFSPPRKDYL
jgi:hypothetical protein